METVIESIKVQKYSTYKDSETKWLGNIPSHWSTLSNKNIFKLKKIQVGKKSGDYVLLSLTLNGVIKRDIENPQGKFPAEFNTYQEVKKGDFIFCLFDVEETPRCVGLSDFDGMITGAYTVMEPYQNFNRNFLYYFYLNLDNDKRLKPLYTGLRNTISKENFFSFKTLVPPLPEQTAIAKFLDRKTELIDQAIDIKQKQIELLKERRQILIHKAVTRGLNPNVKMKDSGVEWIGEIPEHWEVARVKQFSNKISKGTTPSTEGRSVLDEGEIRYIKAENIQDGFITNYPAHFIDERTNALIQRSQLQVNDILFVIAGATLGKIAIVGMTHIPSNTNQAVAFVRPNSKVIPQYLASWLASYTIKELTWLVAVQSAQPNLSMENLGNFPIVLPSFEEQKNILFHIENGTNKIVNAIHLKEQEIEKLKVYKATLINSAVTGKIKVC